MLAPPFVQPLSGERAVGGDVRVASGPPAPRNYSAYLDLASLAQATACPVDPAVLRSSGRVPHVFSGERPVTGQGGRGTAGWAGGRLRRAIGGPFTRPPHSHPAPAQVSVHGGVSPANSVEGLRRPDGARFGLWSVAVAELRACMATAPRIMMGLRC